MTINVTELFQDLFTSPFEVASIPEENVQFILEKLNNNFIVVETLNPSQLENLLYFFKQLKTEEVLNFMLSTFSKEFEVPKDFYIHTADDFQKVISDLEKSHNEYPFKNTYTLFKTDFFNSCRKKLQEKWNM